MDLPDLLTTGGITITVLVLVQYVLKPLIKKSLKLPPYGDETEAKLEDYRFQLNLMALAAGLFLSVVAEIFLTVPVTNQVVVVAVLRGLFGGLGAIGSYETLSNVRDAR